MIDSLKHETGMDLQEISKWEKHISLKDKYTEFARVIMKSKRRVKNTKRIIVARGAACGPKGLFQLYRAEAGDITGLLKKTDEVFVDKGEDISSILNEYFLSLLYE